MTIRKDAFYNAVRGPLFGGSLTSEQVSGMEALFDAWAAYGDGDARKLADIFGQVKRETGARMAPIHELGGDAYFSKYGKGSLAKKLGNLSVADGILYHGRGPIMITGRGNYAKFKTILGVDLVGNPDLALEPKTGAAIAVIGMMRGIFTGKKLGDYFTDKVTDWQNARRTVNGMDHADECATYAKQFYAAILAATETSTALLGAASLASVVPPPEPAATPMTKSTISLSAIGTGAAGTIVVAGQTIKAFQDTFIQPATDTANAAKQAGISMQGLFDLVSNPVTVAILCIAMVGAAGVILYKRYRLAQEQGV